MIDYDYYVSNKQISADAYDCMRGSWNDSAKTTLVFVLLCLLLIGTPLLLGLLVIWWISIPVGLLSLLIISILCYGYTEFCYKLALQENPKTKLIFSGFSKNIMNIVRVSIKKFFLGIFWLVLLVIPFFIKLISYSMATLLMIDQKLTSEFAIKESQHIMKQNNVRYFKFLLSNIHWFVLILLSAGIAFFWLAPLIMTKKSLFYENLKTPF